MRRGELIEFLQRGCGAAPQFDVGLGRRNNELNELTNCRAARRRRVELIEFLRLRDIRAALHGLKAQQVQSPGQRPGLTYVPHLRPVRAKAINNRCAHAFALTGRRAFYPGTQGVALGWELAALSGRSRRNSSLFAPARPRNSLIRVIRCYAV